MSGHHMPREKPRWISNPPDGQWDSWLAMLEGHPLQSALWGSARREAEGGREHRFAALEDGTPVCMARVEERRLPLYGKAAWIPKGPVYAKGAIVDSLHGQLLHQLRQAGFLLALENPYHSEHAAPGWVYRSSPYKTLIIELEKGKEDIWSSFPAKLRSQIKSATRKGVVVERTRDPQHVAEFYQLCRKVSQNKGFDLPGSEELMKRLLHCDPKAPVSSQLFAAFYNGRLIGGYFLMCSDSAIHNIWSGYDRDHGISGTSDLIIWSLLECGMDQKKRCYDQEGIDPQGNPSTYAFKKKFGGIETDLPGLHAYPLNSLGKVALMVGRRLKKI